MLGDVTGKKVTVLAQDSAFGKANIAAVTAVLGGEGAKVDSVEVPAATDVTPFATKIKGSSPDLLFVAWAGTNAAAMWSTLEQQGIFESTKVVTGLDIKPTHAIFGEASTQINFLSHFFDGSADNAAYKALDEGMKEQGATVDLFTNDGFVAAQMIVHAIEASDSDVDAMVSALEGWKFEGPKGQLEIRAEDHAVLQPMFTATLKEEGTNVARPRRDPGPRGRRSPGHAVQVTTPVISGRPSAGRSVAPRSSMTSPSTSGPVSCSASSAPTGRASPRSSTSSAGSPARRPDRSGWAAMTSRSGRRHGGLGWGWRGPSRPRRSSTG